MIDNIEAMQRVRLPLHDGQPAGALHGQDQSWTIHAVRGHWAAQQPAPAQPGHETVQWRLLVEGPRLYSSGDDGFFEVVVRAFDANDGWWMDTA
jgi:hypothetical protein